MKLTRPTDDQVEALVMHAAGEDGWECGCGAWSSGWVANSPPSRWELVCFECLLELFDDLNPALADDETAFRVFVRDVDRRLGRVWEVRGL